MIIIPQNESLPNNPRIGWHNVVTIDNVTASQEAPNHPVTDLANPLTFLYWAGTSTAEQSITVQLGEATAIDYLGLARHNFGSGGISYKVQYSSDGAAWSDATDTESPSDDKVIIHQFTQRTASWWRLLLTPTSTIPRIAVMYLGRILVVQRRIYVGHTPLPYARATTVSTGRSENGQFLGRVVRRRSYENNIDLSNLKPDWYRENMEPFLADAESNPFFFAWRPEDYSDEVGFVWPTGDVRPRNQRSNGMMQVSIGVQGIIE